MKHKIAARIAQCRCKQPNCPNPVTIDLPAPQISELLEASGPGQPGAPVVVAFATIEKVAWRGGVSPASDANERRFEHLIGYEPSLVRLSKNIDAGAEAN
jgi:hypothetical protein